MTDERKRLEKFEAEQLELLKEMQIAGYNIVTCGDCGSVILHKTKVEEIECGYCGLKSEPSDFPDYFY